MLWTVFKNPELYRPVYKINNQEWKRLESPVSITKNEEIELIFEFEFANVEQQVYFAFSYPYSYTE